MGNKLLTEPAHSEISIGHVDSGPCLFMTQAATSDAKWHYLSYGLVAFLMGNEDLIVYINLRIKCERPANLLSFVDVNWQAKRPVNCQTQMTALQAFGEHNNCRQTWSFYDHDLRHVAYWTRHETRFPSESSGSFRHGSRPESGARSQIFSTMRFITRIV